MREYPTSVTSEGDYNDFTSWLLDSSDYASELQHIEAIEDELLQEVLREKL